MLALNGLPTPVPSVFNVANILRWPRATGFSLHQGARSAVRSRKTRQFLETLTTREGLKLRLNGVRNNSMRAAFEESAAADDGNFSACPPLDFCCYVPGAVRHARAAALQPIDPTDFFEDGNPRAARSGNRSARDLTMGPEELLYTGN